MITNSNEACKVLGVEPGASEDDIKSAFRKLSKQLHPDVNKAEDAEQKFKEINEAYQFLQKHGSNYENNFSWNTNWINIQDEFLNSVFQNFGQYHTINFGQSTINNNTIHGNITLTFNESILGASKEVKYTRKGPCDKCSGKGSFSTPTETECKDKRKSCGICAGTGKVLHKEPCKNCHSKCTIMQEATINVSLPPGTIDGQIYSVQYAGDYNVNHLNKWGPARFRVNVLDHASLKRVDNNVVSEINITLLEALKGVTKRVETVEGEKSLVIPPKRKHMDNVVAKGLGVKGVGDHYFIIRVDYPEDVQFLIDVMEKKDGV